MSSSSTPSRWWIVVIAIGGLAGACSSSPSSQQGADLFSQDALGSEPGCVTCHSASARPSVGGPSLMGIGRRVEARIEGVSAEEYLRESVLDPTAYLVNGWGPGMPAYGGVLTTDEVEAIVDYLASLR